MTKRMLIDASHPEETRVVVLDGSKVEEFDFEAASKRPLKGNIYLAKVTRVEPSLQAAFVEYGGNRQGFLAFAEIHPDYYQIPVADRQALIAEQEAEARRRQEDDIESFEITLRAPSRKPRTRKRTRKRKPIERGRRSRDGAAGAAGRRRRKRAGDRRTTARRRPPTAKTIMKRFSSIMPAPRSKHEARRGRRRRRPSPKPPMQPC